MEVGDPQIPARYPTHGTQGTAQIRLRCSYVAITLYGGPFQATSNSFARPLRADLITPHLPLGIQFGLRRVHSPLLTASRLISSPAPTKMFQFGAFPIPTDQLALGSPIRASPVQRLHAPRRGLSQLGTPFFSARAEPSPGWHISSLLVPLTLSERLVCKTYTWPHHHISPSL